MARKRTPGKISRARAEHIRRLEAQIYRDEVLTVAAHEAGHAVAAAVVCPGSLRSVYIKHRQPPEVGWPVGFTDCPVPSDAIAGKGEDAALPWLIQAAAGPEAERMITGCHSQPGYLDDRASAYEIAAAAVCGYEIRDGKGVITPETFAANRDRIENLITRGRKATADLVDTYIRAISRVAEALAERTSLTGAEVAAIVEASRGEPLQD